MKKVNQKAKAPALVNEREFDDFSDVVASGRFRPAGAPPDDEPEFDEPFENEPSPEEMRKAHLDALARQLHEASPAAAIQQLVYGIERQEIERCAIAAWQVRNEMIDGERGDHLFFRHTADAFGLWEAAAAFVEAKKSCWRASLFAGVHSDKMPPQAKLSFEHNEVKQ